MQLAHVFSFSLLGLLADIFSKRPRCLFVMCLGLLLSQGCAMLQRPFGAPTETTTQPAAPETSVGVQPPARQEPAKPPIKKTPPAQTKLPQTGEASWYGAQHHGKKTASGDTFDQAKFTAAHRSLPFGSKIKVTNVANGKSVEVEINDRGPFTDNRIIDLSHAAAKALGMTQSGTTTVRLELSSGQ
jgi:rare lipoprotein A